MKIFNVVEICDNGEFITIVMKNGYIHLPMDGRHSITIQPIEDSYNGNMTITVNVDLYQ